MDRSPNIPAIVLAAVLGLVACQDDLGVDPVVEGAEGERFGSAPPGSTEFEVVPLETPGGAFGRAHGINDGNVVVGVAETDGSLAAFRWTDGTAEELPGLGGSVSGAYAINDAGLVAGEAENADGHLRAVIWSEGEVTDLGTLGGTTSQALAVNDLGQVVGRAQNEHGEFRPFLWWRGEMHELPLPPGDGTFASAEGLNGRGEVVGTVAGSSQLALLWSGDGVRVLETTCSTALAADINGHGQIVGDGTGCDVSPAVGVPLLWDADEPALHLEPLGGLIQPLSSPTLQNGGEATAINSRHEIVGWSTRQPDDFEAVRATLWYRDGVVNMGGEPGSGTLRFAGAADINDRGVAVGVSAETPVLFVAGSGGKTMTDRIAGGARSIVLDRKTGGTAVRALSGSRSAETWARQLCGEDRLRSQPLTVGEILAGC